jgi:hypothetical protein
MVDIKLHRKLKIEQNDPQKKNRTFFDHCIVYPSFVELQLLVNPLVSPNCSSKVLTLCTNLIYVL